MKKYLTPIIFSLIILGVIIFAVFALRSPDKSPTSDTSTVAMTGDKLSQLQAGYSEGPADAKAVLVEFGDYQCPACGAWHPILKNQTLPAYSGKIRFVFKNFPLDKLHKNANISALAAEAAGAQNKYWEMHNLLYEKQNEWVDLSDPSSKFSQYAQTLGLDVNTFNDDVKNKKYQSRIDADRKFGEDLKLAGTPSFFVNGKAVTITANDDSDIRKALDAALAQ